MKIICFYNLDWEKDYLQKHLSDFDIKFVQGTTKDHPELSDKEVDILCLFADSPVDEKLLERFPNLKLVATRSTGYNHIDRGALAAHNVKLSYVPAYGKNTVAEYAFGLMIMLTRKLYETYNRVRDGNFSRKGLCGSDLAGKKLGIIGTGDIGSHVVKIGTAFDMNILAFDIKPNEELAKKFEFDYIPLDKLLAQSDIITLHVPYNKGTHHLINKENILRIKRGAYLINTSRGPVVETVALIKGLKENVLAGAGLDVLEEEGEMKNVAELLLEKRPNTEELQIVLANQYLIKHPHVIVLPHNAFNTFEARKRILDCTIKNIKAFAAGQERNIIY